MIKFHVAPDQIKRSLFSNWEQMLFSWSIFDIFIVPDYLFTVSYRKKSKATKTSHWVIAMHSVALESLMLPLNIFRTHS